MQREYYGEPIGKNLLLHAERLPALDAEEPIEHYRGLVKLTDPETIPIRRKR